MTELDGVAEPDFDSIDAYIARHGLDLTVAEEAMACRTPSSPAGWSARTCPGPRSSG